MSNKESWEEEFRQKWEGANAGHPYLSISSQSMNEIIADISQLLAKAKEEGREEGFHEKSKGDLPIFLNIERDAKEDERKRIIQIIEEMKVEVEPGFLNLTPERDMQIAHNEALESLKSKLQEKI